MKGASGAKYLTIIATIIVGLAVVTAITILDPPSLQRQRKLDARRIQDLRSISHSIDSYWERKKSLPPDLPTLEREPGLKTSLQDPETDIAYIYQVTSSKSYQLCAVFSMDSSDESQEYNSSRKWAHGAGKQCFDLKPSKSEDKSEERQRD